MLKRKLVLATNNPDKIKEITAILNGLPVNFMTLQGISLPEETGQTLEENAILKAKTTFAMFNEITLADDTGLEVEVLGNAPGVYSARFAGAIPPCPAPTSAAGRRRDSPNAVYKENRKKLLTLLEGNPLRKAKFKCVVAVANAENIKTFEGEINGYITDKEIGNQGFGYDSIFFIPELGKTFAQLRAEEKNKISHRAIALLKARKYLENLIMQREF